MKNNFFLFILMTLVLTGTLWRAGVTVSDASDLCDTIECECKGPNCPTEGGYTDPPQFPQKPQLTKEETSWNIYSVAYSLMKNGYLKEAADKFREAVEYNPGNHEAMNWLGVVYMKLERYDDAVSMYRKAAALGNSYAGDNLSNLLDWLARIANKQAADYERRGNYDKAIELYEKALRMKPDYRLAQDNLRRLKVMLIRRKSKMFEDTGAILEEAAFLEKAKEAYMEALKVDPDNTVARQMLLNLELRILLEKAHEYAEQGNADRAREYYREILKLDPGNSNARNMLNHMDEWMATYKGGEFEKKGDHEKAAEYYRKALKHNPAYKKARTALDRIAKLVHNKAIEYYKSGDAVRAREFFKKVLRIDPANQYALENLRKLDINEANKAGAQSMDDGEYEQAIEHFQKVLDLDPENEYASETLRKVTVEQGDANINRGSFSSAAEYYRKALSVYPDNEDLREKLRMAEKVIDWKKAVTGRSGEVPLPKLPSEEDIEEKFIDINAVEWPAMKAALSFAGEVKERAKTEAKHFLRVEAVEQLYKSTVGGYKIVQITRELGETYRQMRDTQLSLRIKLLDQGFGTINRGMLIGRSAHSTVDADEEYSRIIKTGEETENQAIKKAGKHIEDAVSGGWASMIKILKTANEKSRAVVLHFKRGESGNK